ncbi:MAG: hypothetical protein ACRDZ3_09075 [Acidimicrobiia bacterium]
MATSPVRAALPTDLLGGSEPSASATLETSVAGEAGSAGLLPGTDLLGGDLLGSVLAGGLPGTDLLGGDLLGGDVLGGVLGGGDDDADPPAGTAGTEEDPDSGGGINIGGAHIGIRGQNPIETLLGLGCEDTNGIVRTNVAGIALQLPVAVAGLLCPGGGPSDPPGSSPTPDPDPDPEVLPAAETNRPNPGILVAAPPAATPVLTSPVLDAAVEPGSATGPTVGTALPRTGPAGLFQGPFAVGLLGASAALRMVVRRRRPGIS